MLVDLNGDVTFCSHNFKCLNILGNVKNESMFDIWKNNTIRNLMIQNKRSEINPCKFCDVDGTRINMDYFDYFKSMKNI